MEDNCATTVLGIGNILCGDDAFGICAVENLYAAYDFSPCVNIIDGGSQGAALYAIVRASRFLLVLDAVDTGREAGTITVFSHTQIPAWLGMGKISPHQNSFAETLALASLKNELPEEMALIGMQPKTTSFARKMSPPCIAAMQAATNKCLEILHSWGIAHTRALTEKHLLNAEIRNAFCLCYHDMAGY